MFVRDEMQWSEPKLVTWIKHLAHSLVTVPHEGLNDDGQLVFDDVEVAGHG